MVVVSTVDEAAPPAALPMVGRRAVVAPTDMERSAPMAVAVVVFVVEDASQLRSSSDEEVMEDIKEPLASTTARGGGPSAAKGRGGPSAAAVEASLFQRDGLAIVVAVDAAWPCRTVESPCRVGGGGCARYRLVATGTAWWWCSGCMSRGDAVIGGGDDV